MFTPRGVIPALVTPLTREGDLLEQGLRNEEIGRASCRERV